MFRFKGKEEKYRLRGKFEAPYGVRVVEYPTIEAFWEAVHAEQMDDTPPLSGWFVVLPSGREVQLFVGDGGGYYVVSESAEGLPFGWDSNEIE